MSKSILVRTLAIVTLCLAFANAAHAQNCGWSVAGESISNPVEALAVFDDGSGPALYAGGHFTRAGESGARFIARWDGAAWVPLGSEINGSVHALTVFDDGTGPALYAAGRLTKAGDHEVGRIARWDGTSWSPLGSGLSGPGAPVVRSLTVFDDGSGPALYAGGLFTLAGDTPANHIARWNGSSWSPLALGTNGTVFAMTVFDDGSGPALYAGGLFTQATQSVARRIARWDGRSWSRLSTGVNGPVYALAEYDSGSGPELYVGGAFTPADGSPGNRIARWNGSSWSPVGTGVGGGGAPEVRAMTVFDDGSGPALIVAGSFSFSGPNLTRSIGRWDGSSWSELDATTFGGIRAISVFDDGSGPAIFTVAPVTQTDPPLTTRLARWSCTTTCPADLDGNGTLNFHDVTAFLGLYADQDSAADWNNDTFFNFFDLWYYINAFNAGCP